MIFRVTTWKHSKPSRESTTLPQPGSFTVIALLHATRVFCHKYNLWDLWSSCSICLLPFTSAAVCLISGSADIFTEYWEAWNAPFCSSHYTELDSDLCQKDSHRKLHVSHSRQMALWHCVPVDPPKNDNEKPMSCVSCQVIEVAPGPRELVPEASSKILTTVSTKYSNDYWTSFWHRGCFLSCFCFQRQMLICDKASLMLFSKEYSPDL